MTSKPATQRKVLSVSQLNSTVRRMFEQELPPLWIEGEISNLARPASGHWYFTLKDDKAQIRCAMFRRANAMVSRTGFHPDNGDHVLVKGKVSLYEPRGDYQFVADQMEEAGSGALQRAYEQLRTKLQKEGLFSEDKKQDLPVLPQRIGVITSATGAALQDIVNVLNRRMPMIPVLVYPVLVQGELAAADIRRALAQAEQEKLCDVLIIGRGGGSLEDLWAFNDEALARQASACSIPIISAVGHEIDFTILDFVADVRAPTPSAAAELATPVTEHELAGQILYLHERMTTLTRQNLREYTQKVEWLNKHLQLAHPGKWLQQQQQKLDFLSQRLERLTSRHIEQAQSRLDRLKQGLSISNLNTRLTQQQDKLRYLLSRLHTQLAQSVSIRKQQLSSSVRQLNALSPLATLERGYAVVQDSSGKVVTSVQKVRVGDKLSSKLSDGTLQSKVTSINK